MNPKTFHKISYGLYVVGSVKDGKINGQIANTVFQVTSEPPTVAVSICKTNYTHELIQAGKVFAVSILAQDTPMNLIGTFGFKSGRDIDKFQGINYRKGITGAPIVTDNCVGYMECEVINSLNVETHTIFVGKIVVAEIVRDSEPMTYAYYHEVKRGTAPATAPTYIKPDARPNDQMVGQAKPADARMTQYKCTVCGYIYDPAKGDPDSGIKPGTAFTDIPDDWVCPICGVGKDKFEPVD